MHAQVHRFVQAVLQAFQPDEPIAIIDDGSLNRHDQRWLDDCLADSATVRCRVARRTADNDLVIPPLPLATNSIGTFLALDYVQRLRETEELIDFVMPRLIEGGMVILSVDVSNVRPQLDRSRVLTPLGLERLAAQLDAALVGWQGDGDFPRHLYLIACRAPTADRFASRARRFLEAIRVSTSRPRAGWRGWLQHRKNEGEQPCFSLHLPEKADWKQALLDTRANS